MRELMQSTRRIRRGWLDRLRGYKRLFETEITDGEHTAFGRRPTPEVSQKAAQHTWDAQFGQERQNQIARPLLFVRPIALATAIIASKQLSVRIVRVS
jgi:hypothetical protein